MRIHASLFGVLTLSLRGKKEKRKSGTGSNAASPLPSILSVLQKKNFFLQAVNSAQHNDVGYLKSHALSVAC